MHELPLSTLRLKLRRFESADLEPFFGYRSQTAIGRYQGWIPLTLEDAAEFVAEQRVSTLDLPGRWFHIAITLRASNAIIGDVGLSPVTRDEVEIGVTLAPEAQGHGYAAEAVEAIARTLFRAKAISTLRALTDARNVKSIALLERLGFEHQRTTSEIFHGQWRQQHRYALSCNR